MPDRTCSVEDCEDRSRSRGLCNIHYCRAKKAGALPAEWEPDGLHRLTEVDLVAQTAVCRVCGPTTLELKRSHGNIDGYRCLFICQATRRAKLREKRIAAGLPPEREPYPYPGQAKRRSALARKYGITLEEYQQMFAAQGGKCAICESTPKRLMVDHNHGTGAVRALLCFSCNTGMGHFGDDPSRLLTASIYLNAFTASPFQPLAPQHISSPAT